MIGVIDYGVGNIASVVNALEFLGLENTTLTNATNIDEFSHLILPGVGAFHHGMEELRARGFEAGIKAHCKSGKPFLGICLGMQLLLTVSYENGTHGGLDIIKGSVLPLRESVGDLIVPHVGWNDVVTTDSSSIVDVSASYYFVHSYYCKCASETDEVGYTEYGIKFASMIENSNVFGVQFHPEKSHKNGLQILRKFSEFTC